jgi:glyoxylase-like metal-dependent hydrolase (beta-lactamase superfamily II)/rhodanese-related sulfurtransferase
MDESTEINPATLYDRLRRGEPVAILDVRDRDEHDAWPIEGAAATRVVPYARVAAARATDDLPALVDREGIDELAAATSDPIVVVCGRGEASDTVAEWLRAAPVDLDAVNLADGMRGWARVYDAVELDVGIEGAGGAGGAGAVTVLQYDRPASGCLAYLVVADGEAAVIDPLRAFADRYVTDAHDRGARIRYAIDTHVHADHVSGVRAVAERARQRQGGSDGASPGGDRGGDLQGDVEVVVPTGATDRGLAFEARLLADGERLPLGGTELAAVHLPGHTTENTGLRLGPVLFGGDALFLESVARPDLEAGAAGAREFADRLYDTLHDRVLGADEPTLLAPTHRGAATERGAGGYVASVPTLRDRLPALSLDREAFVDYLLADMPPRPNNYERIIETNLGRATATDEEAFEWELGPNNCAATREPDATAD